VPTWEKGPAEERKVEVHREAVAALLLFQEAAHREALRVELVEEMSWHFR
jgi:hypothetical protein